MAEETKKTKKTWLSRFRKSKKVEESKEEVVTEAAPVKEKTSPKVRTTTEKPRMTASSSKAKPATAPTTAPKAVNWDIVRAAVHRAGWDTTVYPSDLDKVVDAAKRGGSDAVRKLRWLAAANRYAALVERLIK